MLFCKISQDTCKKSYAKIYREIIHPRLRSHYESSMSRLKTSTQRSSRTPTPILQEPCKILQDRSQKMFKKN